MPTGLVISINSFDSQHPSYNDLGGAYGPLNSDYVSLAFDRSITHDGSLASLKVDFTNLPDNGFAGVWNSLINSRRYLSGVCTQCYELGYLRFYVRGSGASTNVMSIENRDQGVFHSRAIPIPITTRPISTFRLMTPIQTGHPSF